MSPKAERSRSPHKRSGDLMLQEGSKRTKMERKGKTSGAQKVGETGIVVCKIIVVYKSCIQLSILLFILKD